MSDTIDDFRFMKEVRTMRRRMHGIDCPSCRERRPRAIPTLLVPGQRCKIDGFTDPRPELTEAQDQAVFDAVSQEAVL